MCIRFIIWGVRDTEFVFSRGMDIGGGCMFCFFRSFCAVFVGFGVGCIVCWVCLVVGFSSVECAFFCEYIRYDGDVVIFKRRAGGSIWV